MFKSMSKWKFFMWKLLYDRLATKEQLRKTATLCRLLVATYAPPLWKLLIIHLKIVTLLLWCGKVIPTSLTSLSMILLLFENGSSNKSCSSIMRIVKIVFILLSSLPIYGAYTCIIMNENSRTLVQISPQSRASLRKCNNNYMHGWAYNILVFSTHQKNFESPVGISYGHHG